MIRRLNSLNLGVKLLHAREKVWVCPEAWERRKRLKLKLKNKITTIPPLIRRTMKERMMMKRKKTTTKKKSANTKKRMKMIKINMRKNRKLAQELYSKWFQRRQEARNSPLLIFNHL